MISPMQPKTLIIRTAGTNCDRELAHAFELAGASTQTVHLNALIDDPTIIDQAQLIGFPGGFSYGDDIAAGRIFANRIRHHLLQPLLNAVQRGVPIIGICNGFQVLVKLGLLPDANGNQSATLADNTSGRFLDRWTKLQVPLDTACIWTRNLSSGNDFELPIAHAEGRFAVDSDQLIEQLRENKQIAICYQPDDNPNGSAANIAGICDRSGVVFGLMPHPERYTHTTNHPQWTRQNTDPAATAIGLQMFKNAVQHVKNTVNA